MKAKGIKAFAGHCGKPPGVSEAFPDAKGAREERQALDDHDEAKRHEENEVAEKVEDRLAPQGKRTIEDVHADMAVLRERSRRAAEHDAGKQKDRKIEQHRPREMSAVAQKRVRDADEAGGEHEPGRRAADGRRQRVDATRCRQQHCPQRVVHAALASSSPPGRRAAPPRRPRGGERAHDASCRPRLR